MKSNFPLLTDVDCSINTPNTINSHFAVSKFNKLIKLEMQIKFASEKENFNNYVSNFIFSNFLFIKTNGKLNKFFDGFLGKPLKP